MENIMRIGTKSQFILAVCVAMLCSTSLFAQKRIYRSSQPVGKFIPALIDAMADSGMKFSVERAYDEKSDGKLGLLLTMKPGGRVVDISFHDENGKTTLVAVRYQDPADSSLFNRLFIQKLNMTEIGLGKIDDSVPAGWPSPSK